MEKSNGRHLGTVNRVRRCCVRQAHGREGRHVSVLFFVVSLYLLGALGVPYLCAGEDRTVTISVGPADADVIGDDNVAIQRAIDRVSTAGGGKVLIRAGTYSIHNTVHLPSHITLQGEGSDKTILKKDRGVISRLKHDAEADEFEATVEDTRGFAPGMGVAVIDNVSRLAWCPPVTTIQRMEGSTLFFDRYLDLNFLVENGGRVSNIFPIIEAYEAEDVDLRDLTADSARVEVEPINSGCTVPAIFFYHSKKVSIRSCVARNFAGDGICVAAVEEALIENCEAYGNAQMGIHLGAGAYRCTVRHNRSHGNGWDGLYLCWRVQHGVFERNESWANAGDGISIGHKDTDNIFLQNVVRNNGKAGFHFRDEPETNAGHRNTLRENVIEDNGRPDAPGYGVRIDGATQYIIMDSNTIGETRSGDQATQQVGVYVGPNADYITCERNSFDGNLKRPLVDESKSGHNKLLLSVGK